MTHAELVKRAEQWLRNTARCGVVLTEASGGWEIPDAIGWRRGGTQSFLVECKASRADFHADRDKPSRKNAELAPGRERYYMAPEGLIGVGDLPESWGLLWVGPSRVKKVKAAVPTADVAGAALREIGFLVSELRKVQILQNGGTLLPTKRTAGLRMAFMEPLTFVA